MRDIRHGLVKHMAEVRDRKRLYETELCDHMLKKPRAMEALYEQVGNVDESSSTTGTATTRSNSTLNGSTINVARQDGVSRVTMNEADEPDESEEQENDMLE